MKKVAVIVLALVGLVVFGTSALAQQPIEYTVTVKAEPVRGTLTDHFLTFSGPVQLPGVTLQAGTYIFSPLGSSVLQVMSTDRSQVYAMFFTTPVFRAETADQVEMTFVRTDYSTPLRIDKWFLPNQTIGFEFLYQPIEWRGDR